MRYILKKFVLLVVLSVFFLNGFSLPTIFASPVAPSVSPRFKSAIKGFYRDRFVSPTGIFIDREHDEIYVADSGRGEVFIFDTSGTPLFRLGRSSGITLPLDVAVSGDRIYVSQEGRPYVDILDQRGEPAGRLTMGDTPFLPGRMDTDDEGNLYVINKKLGVCHVFDRDGKFLRTIGEDLTSLAGVGVGRDRVYLITPFYRRGRVIHVYGKDGAYIRSFEGIEAEGGTLVLPTAAKVDPFGNLWVVDSLRGVSIYDKEGNKINAFGWAGPVYERLLFPVDIDFDGRGMIYFVDKENKRISVFK